MKFFKVFFILSVACLLMSGCAKKGLYKDSTWVDAPTSLRIVFEEPMVTDMGDVKRNLPEFVGHFSDWFLINVAEDASQVAMPGIQISSEKGALAVGSLQRNGKMEYVPMYSPMNQAQVYLLLSNITFGREFEEYYQGPQYGMAGPGFGGAQVSFGFTSGATTRVENFFRARCRYAFYDAQSGKLLAYGDEMGSVKYVYNKSRKAWDKSLYEMVKRIIAHTPLR